MKLLKVICIFLSALCANAGVLPVEKCKLDDSSCMKEAYQKALPTFMSGIPEIGIEVLDVMELDDFSFDLSGLQFSMTNAKLKGLKNAVIDDVKWNLKKKYFDIYFHLDCSLKGHYVASGKILVLPITGDGQMKLKLKNAHFKFHTEYKIEKGADGKDHVVPTKHSFEFDVKDNANFQLTNLFNGNKELSDAMLMFLNGNWKQISQEFGQPIIEVVERKIHKNIGHFFELNAIEDIAVV